MVTNKLKAIINSPQWASSGGTPAGANPTDITGVGGGNIGTGGVPTPGGWLRYRNS